MPITTADGISSESASRSRVRVIHRQALEWVWPQILEVLRAHPRNLLDGHYTEEEVYRGIFTGAYDLWIGLSDLEEGEIEFVAFCRFEPHASYSTYRILWVGGNFAEHLDDATEQVSRYAREVLKADKLVFCGRPGWIRKMEKFDFQIVHYELWKSLERSN